MPEHPDPLQELAAAARRGRGNAQPAGAPRRSPPAPSAPTPQATAATRPASSNPAPSVSPTPSAAPTVDYQARPVRQVRRDVPEFAMLKFWSTVCSAVGGVAIVGASICLLLGVIIFITGIVSGMTNRAAAEGVLGGGIGFFAFLWIGLVVLVSGAFFGLAGHAGFALRDYLRHRWLR